jgi:hypothetical protein
MICENCKSEHDGKYSSGRFCCVKCARSFSTKNKRKEINLKVSKKLKGHKPTAGCFKKGHIVYHTFTKEDRKKAKIIISERREERIKNLPFEKLPIRRIKKIVFLEQEGKCNICKITNWNNLAITFELHHRDGDDGNNKRENLEYLCPNCHSQTANYRSKSIPIKKMQCKTEAII